MICICILKDKTFDRIKEKYNEEIEFINIKSLEELKQELSIINCDFAILDYNNYDYHSIIDCLESENIKVYNFDGKFNTINDSIEEEIQNKENEENIKSTEGQEIKIVNKYIEIEVEKEVEKIVEIEKVVEKVIEKKIYQKIKIGIASEKKGIGCTHYCFTFANYLKDKNKSVAIVEIGKHNLKNMKKSNIDIIHFKNLDEYYSSSKVREYDYIIIDLGYYDRDNFKEIFLQCDFKIVILGSKEYEENKTSYFFKEMLNLKIIKDIYYIYNFASQKRFKELTYDIEELNVYRGYYNEDFEINEDIDKLINDILQIEEYKSKKKAFKIDKIILPSIIAILLLIMFYIVTIK